MRIARLLTTAVALIVALGAAPVMADDSQAPADGTAAQRSELRAQAEANDLSPEQARSLQAQVDEVVADTGGTQVAINQVRWDGGDTLIPLPGETEARELGVAPSAAGPHGCNSNQFCIYKYDNYQGINTRIGGASCTWHDVRGKNLESYVNNLRPFGRRAHFYYFTLDHLTGTKPSPDKGTIPFEVNINTAYVRPC